MPIVVTYQGGVTHHSHVSVRNTTGVTRNPASSDVQVNYVNGTGEYKSPRDTTPWIRGAFKVTAYERDKVHVQCTPAGSVQWQAPDGSLYTHQYTASGPLLGKNAVNLNHFFAGAPNHTELALTKAYAKIASNRLDLAVEFGELGETLNLIRKPYRNVGKILKKFDENLVRWSKGAKASKKQPTLKEYVDSVSGTWLETRFGLMPALRSLQSMVDEYRRKVKRFNAAKIHRAVGSVKTKGTYENTNTVDYAYYASYATTESNWKQKTRACCYYRLAKPLSRASEWGLGVSDLPPSFWELLPWSFVVDRFLNIGDYLRSHCIQPEVQLLGNTVGVKQEAALTVSARFHPISDGAKPNTFAPGTCSATRERYVRVINVPVPTTPSVTNLSTLTNALHIADHIALTQSLLSGRNSNMNRRY